MENETENELELELEIDGKMEELTMNDVKKRRAQVQTSYFS